MNSHKKLLDAFEDFLLTKPLIQHSPESASIYENYFVQHVALPEAWRRFYKKSEGSKLIASQAIGYSVALACFLFGALLFSANFLFWLLFRRREKLCIDCCDGRVAIATCNTSNRRLKKFSQIQDPDLPIFFLDLGTTPWLGTEMNDRRSVYDFFSVKELLLLILISLKDGKAKSNFNGLFELTNRYFTSLSFLRYAAIRVFYDSVNEVVLDRFLSNAKVKTVIAGCTNERYGVFLTEICSRRDLKTVCVPHGVSPKIILPNGVFGQTYYCLTQAEKHYLDNNYPTQRHLFDEALVSQLFLATGKPQLSGKPKIVVATSSRNRLGDQALVDAVSRSAEAFGVRLHPNDKAGFFCIPANGTLLNSYPEAVCNVVLFVKLSAITIDAAINGSRVYVVIDTLEDRFEYRFLYGAAVHPAATILDGCDGIEAALGNG